MPYLSNAYCVNTKTTVSRGGPRAAYLNQATSAVPKSVGRTHLGISITCVTVVYASFPEFGETAVRRAPQLSVRKAPGLDLNTCI